MSSAMKEKLMGQMEAEQMWKAVEVKYC